MLRFCDEVLSLRDLFGGHQELEISRRPLVDQLDSSKLGLVVFSLLLGVLFLLLPKDVSLPYGLAQA